MIKAAFVSLVLLSASAVAAEPRTVTLAVERMTCVMCPITVRKALSKVAGVSASTVSMASHTATVVFDPDRTTPEMLATAVTQAGFPAKVLRDGH